MAARAKSDNGPMLGSEDGAVAVEAAIVMSAFLVLILGLIEFAQVFWIWNTMMLALEEGGRYAMVYNQGPPAWSCNITGLPLANCAVARANAVSAAYLAPSVVVTCTAGPSNCTTVTNTTMTLQGQFTFNFIPSGLLPYGPITLTSTVTVPLD